VQFTNEFTAPAAPDEVFAALLDIRGVAGCLPGAVIGEDTADGGLEATVAVKVGPIRMTYGGTLHVVERDDAARTASMRVRAREQRGQGTAEATLGLAVADDGGSGGSRATVTTDLMVTGRVAQMGAGIMQDVAASMVDEFAACLSARLTPAAAAAAESQPPPPAEAAREVKALPLLWKSLKTRLGRLFGRR
jgi:carbon monoxide dehydrogenase subunit G